MGAIERTTHSRELGKTERVEARVTSAQKDVLITAATLLGRSLTDFVITSAYDTARRTIQEHQVLNLTLKDRTAFFEAVRNPPEPSERLKAAAGRYKEYTGR